VNPSTAARAVRVLADEGRVNIIRAWGAFVAEQ
jgi:DNA-binding transcriptional regulator YhcF (GntR family)